MSYLASMQSWQKVVLNNLSLKLPKHLKIIIPINYVKSSDDVDAIDKYLDLINGFWSKVSEELPQINVELVESCIKFAGGDSIVAEHITHCYPHIIIHTKLLFTMMVSHSYVPEQFGIDIIIPVPKDISGDLSSPDNYKPISLSPFSLNYSNWY